MRYLFCAIAVLFTACATTNIEQNDVTINSPNGELSVLVTLENRALTYSVYRNNTLVLEPSSLGIKVGGSEFYNNLSLVKVSAASNVTDAYSLKHGKQKDISYKAVEQVITYHNSANKKFNVRWRVSDDGVAFRYELLGRSETAQVVEAEYTSFNFPQTARAWLQPVAVAQTGWSNTNPSYEEHYLMDIPVGEPSPTEAGWVFPALFSSNSQWVAITEAGMNGQYHGSRLQTHSPDGNYQIGYPMAAEVFTNGALMANATLPFNTPWRIITVGELAQVVESTLGTDLAAPAIKAMPFVEPGFATWSWALLKDDSVNFETQLQFIDYAAEMGWQYTLIDVEWDKRIGEQKIKELVEYAKQKGVGLLLWYNSSGAWNVTEYTPKSRLLNKAQRREEFAKLQEWGIKGVKIDFFAGDGQSMMAYYQDLFKDAADFELLVNCHGSTLPRGLHRTYPNLMTMEAVKGFEFITFTQENADLAASHVAMLPFSRNLFDPMDFTPTTFGEIPGIKRLTTNGFELALPVLFTSGIQHIAETADGIKQVPDYIQEVLKSIPILWDETRFVAGYPGKEAVLARRVGNTWYVAGVNGENTPKELELDLSFIKSKAGTYITDGSKKFEFHKSTIQATDKTTVSVQAYGGFLMVFK